jgi:hypothetical protein
MDRLSINLSDYGYQSNGQGGYGSASAQEVDALNKALAAGEITGRETTGMTDASGAPLKVESLEKTLKHITFRESDIRLWKDIPKKPAYNTVEEYNQQTSYGQDRGGFNAEGELPEEEDSIYVRRAQLVKYLGVTKSVTHQMTLVNTMIGNIMQKTIKDGTLWILRKLTKSLYFGNEKLIPLEFNGFLAQQEQSDAWANHHDYMNSDNVVDMRGASLSEDAIESGANTIVENYGLGTQLYAAPSVLSGFVKQFYGNKFIMPNTAALTDGVMGQHVKSFESQFGNIGLNQDVFFKKNPAKDKRSPKTTDKAPNKPTISVAAVASDANSKWGSSDAGTVFYAVSAINRYGESDLAIAGAGTAVVAGGAADITITDGGGTNKATAYRIYRTYAGGTADSQFYPLFEVSLDDVTRGYDGGAAGSIRDVNYWLPNCDQAMLVQFDNEVVEFAQLAPLMKMDLALLSPAYRFMILLYGTPFLYAPKKMVRIINIGQYKKA